LRLRTTAGLAVLAAVLGTYVYLVEIRGTRNKVEEEAAARRVLRVDPEEIAALEVPLDGGGEARLERAAGDEESWRLVSPIDYPADSGVVSGIVSALAELESKATIDDPPRDLGPFGLAETPPAVRVFLRGKEQPRVLELGEKAPVGALRYVRLSGEPSLYTVEEWRTSGLRPRLVSLRDKRVMERKPEEVTGVRIFDRGTLLMRAVVSQRDSEAGEQTERSWEIVEPIRELADSRRIRRLLEELNFLRAIDFVDEPEDLSRYGLHRPEIVLELDAGSERDQIEIGRQGSQVYLQTGRGRTVFQVSDRALADVPRDLFAYRHKQVLKIEEERAAKVELRFPRSEAAYSFSREKNEWKPDQEGVLVGSLRIEDILYAIRDLEAKGLEERSVALDGLGLDPPGVRVTVKDDEGKELGWLELGDPEAHAGIAARSSQSDRLWRIENEIGKDVPLTLEAFRNSFLEKPPAEEATEPEREGEPAGEDDEEDAGGEG
jgi:hypothetical protein